MKPVDAHQGGKVRFFVIADDLTGACDSAIAFAQRGLAVEVLMEGSVESSTDGTWAVSTESRDVPVEIAVQRVRDSLMRATQASEIFKKVDSVFRGNSFAEIRAAVDFSSCDLAVMSPAYPLMGRTVKDGILRITEAGGERIVDLRDGLARAGMSEVSTLHPDDAARPLSERIRDVLKAGKKFVLCDAESSEDLRSTIAEARLCAEDILWIGSGGLAHALASELPKGDAQKKERLVDGLVVLFVGSDHVVTRKQIEALKNSVPVLESTIEDFLGTGSKSQVVVLNVTRNATTTDQIRQAFSLLAPHAIACCLLTGGDTAALVCRALGVRSLRLHEEFAPGLPQGVAVGGLLDEVPVILKSGGFGNDDVLFELSSRFTVRKELA